MALLEISRKKIKSLDMYIYRGGIPLKYTIENCIYRAA